jgi:hypothetical protein
MLLRRGGIPEFAANGIVILAGIFTVNLNFKIHSLF